jgi:sugar lactone lactonase YvrE
MNLYSIVLSIRDFEFFMMKRFRISPEIAMKSIALLVISCFQPVSCSDPDGAPPARAAAADPSGALANKREFMRVTEPDVYPDGPAVDSAGNVWLALFGGWGVRCYSPAGELLQHIALPVARCTKIAFAGADLRSLYITTAAVGLSPEELARQPLAGGLFRTRADIPGLPPGEFAG